MVGGVAPIRPLVRVRGTIYAIWRIRGSMSRLVKSMRRISRCMRWQERSVQRQLMNWRGYPALTKWKSRDSQGIVYELRLAKKSAAKAHAASSSLLTQDRTLVTRIPTSRIEQTRMLLTILPRRVKAMNWIEHHRYSKIIESRQIRIRLTIDTRLLTRGCSHRGLI